MQISGSISQHATFSLTSAGARQARPEARPEPQVDAAPQPQEAPKSQDGGRFSNINRPISGATHDKDRPVGEHPMQLYSLATPNGVKVTVMLEELLERSRGSADEVRRQLARKVASLRDRCAGLEKERARLHDEVVRLDEECSAAHNKHWGMVFREANEIDPFLWTLHADWGRSLAALERWSEAEREFRVALLVPEDLDLLDDGPLQTLLFSVQHDLFDIGAELCQPGKALLTEDYVAALEQQVEAFNADLQPLKEFILPGGSPAVAALQLARTVCRRAERGLVALDTAAEVNPCTRPNIQARDRFSNLL